LKYNTLQKIKIRKVSTRKSYFILLVTFIHNIRLCCEDAQLAGGHRLV